MKHMHALTLAALLTACGGSPTASDNTVANRKAEASTPAPQRPPAALGKTEIGPGFEFTVRSVEQRTAIGMSDRVAAGETFVVVRYEFKNTSNEPVSRGGRPEMRLVDGQGRSYSDDGGVGLGLNGLRDAIDDTNPGVTARVAAVWRVDKASFDAGGWTLVLATQPPLRFALV